MYGARLATEAPERKHVGARGGRVPSSDRPVCGNEGWERVGPMAAVASARYEKDPAAAWLFAMRPGGRRLNPPLRLEIIVGLLLDPVNQRLRRRAGHCFRQARS
jgi:hypothetical protein